MSFAPLVVSRRSDDPVVLRQFFLSSRESITIEVVDGLGTTPPLRVFKDDTISSVELKIHNCTGFVFKNQKLVYGGRELLRSDSLVSDYDIANKDVFHIMVKLMDLQAIDVTTVCGKKLSFNDIVKHDDNGVILLIVWGSSRIRFKHVGKSFEFSIGASDVIGKKKYEYECDGNNAGVKDILVPVFGNPEGGVPKSVLDLIEMTKNGLVNGHSPVMSAKRSGGAYLMLDSTGSEYVSVFKPHELPSTSDGERLKRGARAGQRALGEVSAYILDHPISGRCDISGDAIGFSGVPPFGMVKCLYDGFGFNHPNGLKDKFGSLQKFMKNNGSCKDISPPDAFPVEEVHKISVLDMRLANADRHSGNILFSKDTETGRITLIPIDHGYCLPESFEDCTFDWLYWPQAKQPYSPETVNYIKSLDAEQDIALLKFNGWDIPVESARTLRISTMLLKKGVERRLTPYTIGNFMCRETLRKESVIEEIVQEAMDAVLPCTSEALFMGTVSEIMDRRLDELSG